MNHCAFLMESFSPALLSTLVGIGLFLLGHLFVAIWFASNIRTQVGQLVESSKAMAGELTKLSAFDGRIQVVESRLNRAEMDAREALKAAAEVNRHLSP